MNNEEKNRNMFERWNKVRQTMSCEEIVIAEVIIPEEDKKYEPDHVKDEISIMKHGEPELYPNYFMWSAYRSDNKTWELIDAAPNYKDLISVHANIKWLNTAWLEDFEKQNLDSKRGDQMDYTENCTKAMERWQYYYDPEDFIGNLPEDIFVGVGKEIFQFLNKENSIEKIREVYGKVCKNCQHDRNTCYMYEHRENCIIEELAYSWLRWLSDLPKEYKELMAKRLPQYSNEGIQCLTLKEVEDGIEYFVDMEEVINMFVNWRMYGRTMTLSRVYGDTHNYIWVWLDDESEPDYNPYRDLFFFIVPSVKNEDKEKFQKIYRAFVDILNE